MASPTNFGASEPVTMSATNDPFYVARDEVSQALQDVNNLVVEYKKASNRFLLKMHSLI